jgi:hypothetical protein
MGWKMIVRKSNLAKAASFRPTLAFHALAWIEFPPNRRLAFVTLAQDEQDFSYLLLHDVIIDRVKYFCVDVRLFTPGPHHKGDSIGLVVVSIERAEP